MDLQLPLKLQAAPGVWLARADREDLAAFGHALSEDGERSVILVRNLACNSESDFLQARPGGFQIINLGKSKEVLVIAIEHPIAFGALLAGDPEAESLVSLDGVIFPDSARAERTPESAPKKADGDVQVGDYLFLKLLVTLEPHLQRIGLAILAGVRAANPSGRLTYYFKSKRFVESPDNFWAIQYQPQLKDFMIVIRARREEVETESLAVQEDRPSYSSFKVRDLSEVPEALRLILSARRKGQR